MMPMRRATERKSGLFPRRGCRQRRYRHPGTFEIMMRRHLVSLATLFMQPHPSTFVLGVRRARSAHASAEFPQGKVLRPFFEAKGASRWSEHGNISISRKMGSAIRNGD
jgi:hypothetical protein